MKFSVLFTFITALLLMIVNPTYGANKLPIEKMKACTVRVLCKTSQDGSSGSGVIVGDGSYVITNHHVISCVNRGGRVSVLNSSEVEYDADVLWMSKDKDLAILSFFEPISVFVPSFATSNMVHEADAVFALGFPGAADITRDSQFQVKFTKGIISARTNLGGVRRIYQTDAAINSGNSGGPLFNDKGQVIGINFAKIYGYDTEGIGYAVQVDEILPVMRDYDIPYSVSNNSTSFPKKGHEQIGVQKKYQAQTIEKPKRVDLEVVSNNHEELLDQIESVVSDWQAIKGHTPENKIHNGKITYHAISVNIRDFLNFISTKSNRKLIVDEDLNKKIKINIVNEDLDLAIASVLNEHGCTIVRNKNDYYVIPNEKKSHYYNMIRFQ